LTCSIGVLASGATAKITIKVTINAVNAIFEYGHRFGHHARFDTVQQQRDPETSRANYSPRGD